MTFSHTGDRVGQDVAALNKEQPRESEIHIPEIDGLRGVACLLVVLMHCGLGLTVPALGAWQPVAWRSLSGFMIGGVDLFFCISGFLIGGILIDNKSSPNYFKVFWIRRAGRILPVYFLLLASYWVTLQAGWLSDFPWAGRWLLLDPLPLWPYLTFTVNNLMAWTGETGALWVGITWSLAVEEQFYVAFPFIAYFVRARWLAFICLAGICIAPLIRWAIWANGGSFYMGYFPTFARVDALMFGVGVAMIVRNKELIGLLTRYRRIFDVIAVLMVVCLTKLVVQATLTLEYSMMGLVYAYAILRVYLQDGVFNALLRNPTLTWFGAISYPLYMYHQATNGLTHGFIAGQVPTIASLRDLGIAVTVLAISVALAWASTRHFEAPFRQWSRRWRF